MLSEDDKATVLALVHAHVSNCEDYVSWIRSYCTIRNAAVMSREFSSTKFARPTQMSVRVGGHYRRKALYRTLLAALVCTCKFEKVHTAIYLQPPPCVAKRRWDESGAIIPVKDRQYEFFLVN